ncbi:MAG: hypothetical protein Q8O91_00315, partial [Candidatus Aminicenantes bacterium]|nr:hypothetical protein [Candidatus Aminicenantes bacterium]
MDPRAKPGALTRDVNTRLSTAETDPQTKPGAPAAAPPAGDADFIKERSSGYPLFLQAFVHAARSVAGQVE